MFDSSWRASAPCHAHTLDYLQPGERDDWDTLETTQAALARCRTCPHRAACADDGLKCGTTADGEIIAAADGVIIAGVVCRGDHATLRSLRAVADPTYNAATACLACRKSFDETPHKAHGLCGLCARATHRRGGRPTASQSRNTCPPACIEPDCQIPLVPWGHARPDGYGRHEAAGRCRRCHQRWRKANPNTVALRIA